METDLTRERNLALAVFQQAWNDAEGKFKDSYEKKNPNIINAARSWLMGKTKEDREEQAYWNQFIQDDRFIEQTQLEARRRWAFGVDRGRKNKEIESLDIEIPQDLEQIECSLHRFCESKGISYSKVYRYKRKFGLTDEQAVYVVLNKEGK